MTNIVILISIGMIMITGLVMFLLGRKVGANEKTARAIDELKRTHDKINKVRAIYDIKPVTLDNIDQWLSGVPPSDAKATD